MASTSHWRPRTSTKSPCSTPVLKSVLRAYYRKPNYSMSTQSRNLVTTSLYDFRRAVSRAETPISGDEETSGAEPDRRDLRPKPVTARKG